MVSLKEFFNKHEDELQKGVVHKNNLIKRNIVAYMAAGGPSTIAELTAALHISIPTMTKLVGELVDDRLVHENGKIETTGGRRPNIYGLTSTAIYFAGVNVGRDNIQFVVTDIQNNIIATREEVDFELVDTDECLHYICRRISAFIDSCEVDSDRILGLGVCITGRVNSNTGRSYKYFTSQEESLTEVFEQATGVRTLLENDTRARCYAEYNAGSPQDGENILYLHLGRGVAIGIVMDGKLFYGKSGFAGEFGHTPFFDNEKICSCGKKGCLETEISGVAVEEKIVDQLRRGSNTILREKFEQGENIHINDIITAARNDDNLSIELIEEVGEKAGKSIAFLINIFNPETVIIGGNLARAGDYIMLPLKASTNKYSLNLVYKDTRFRLSRMGQNAGALGAAMLMRGKIIGLA
ncbi:MAG: ROK family transcriptional regulator [Alistipes sp.]|jgi:predicted NBD/HSP70 family sugar kinase|nr:ROK family transcriptional regulator [Alistipes sp.]